LISSQMAPRLMDRIGAADDHTSIRHSRSTGKPYFFPNQERSELGAGENIELRAASEKINFSSGEAIEWYKDPDVSGGYLIELFEMPDRYSSTLGRSELLQSLKDLMLGFGLGMKADFLRPFGKTNLIDFRLTSDQGAPVIQDLRFEPYTRDKTYLALNENFDFYQKALIEISGHPLVRCISLPPKIFPSSTQAVILSQMGEVSISKRVNNQSYPKIGVIDTGVSDVLDEWVIDRHDFLSEEEVESGHGTFIGGLLVDAQSLNGTEVGRENDGCLIYDIPIFPKNNFRLYYKSGFNDFLEEVEQAVSEAKENFGIRIFNLSINATSSVDADDYSYYASRLDEIAEKYDIIFINSVGNLSKNESRSPWPKKPMKALEYFAARTEADTIFKPCESVSNLAVGAINPPNMKEHHAGTPTTYTRRGPGLRVGNKPDLAHYGGSQPDVGGGFCGLMSISTDGNLVSGCGTSYATPLVAKTIAALDEKIETEISIHTLRALMIHHTEIPTSISSARLKHLARQFIGFGLPLSSDDMLVTDDHSITMVFTSNLVMGHKKGWTAKPKILRFPFTWPKSLTDAETGVCYGAAKMTLVYLPPLDRRFGSEFVRINMDAKLQQRQPVDRKDGKPSFNSVIDQCYLPKTADQPAYEKELVKHGLKWWPTKKYEKTIPKQGLGSSSEWRLEVECSMRAEADFPSDGVPFALIVTISDPEKERPIFQELHRDLQTKNVNLTDIRSSVRIRPQGQR